MPLIAILVNETPRPSAKLSQQIDIFLKKFYLSFTYF